MSEFRIYRPSPALARYVHCYWTLETRGGTPQTIFPDGRPEIVVHLGDPAIQDGRRQPSAILVGQMRGPVGITPGAQTQSFGIRLNPAGAFALFGFNQSEITDRIVELEPKVARALRGAGPGQVVEAELLKRCKAPEPRIEAAISRIANRAGRVTVDALARHVELTPRHLERLFQAQVGIDPKTLARIVRFQRVVTAPAQNWAALAADAGYFDQAHLIRDFRRFTGLTPAAWAEKRVAFLQDTGAAAH